MHSNSPPTPGTSLRLPRAVLVLLLVVACLGPLLAAGPARPAHRTGGGDAAAVRALAQSARPLTSTTPGAPGADLRPLDRMIGTARIVGLGEATHNSGEFFRMKHRVFKHLVEKKGFTTFALEANWSAGLRLNDYVLHGRGDLDRIMREEFQNAYLMWNVREYRELIEWMRAHNRTHDRKVQFMGNDLGYAGPVLFDTVERYVAAHYPRLAPEFEKLYRASRPTAGVEETMSAYLRKPLPERRAMGAQVERAYDLLARQRPGAGREEHAWVLQHARVIAQVGKEYTYDLFDDEEVADAMRHRDEAMARNTAWWQRHTGHRMLLSAHNGHVGLETSDPAHYPKLQGEFLRELVGDGAHGGYVSIGFTFGQGSFNANDLTDPKEPIRTFTVGPAAQGSNERTLERVARGDYYLDLRTAPAAARAWLGVARPTRSIGTAWPAEPEPVRLGATFDVLVHLHRITAADRL
ncbi:erythromycin esterase family protein [Streptomyces monticola]|uniref:Erythromycin esterase family protein n=1 Tax=Streptomyces monticola TaxID=2666263 RepID=A0ABW2JNJ1_9ACTN